MTDERGTGELGPVTAVTDGVARDRYQDLTRAVGSGLDTDSGLIELAGAERYDGLARDIVRGLDLRAGLDGALNGRAAKREPPAEPPVESAAELPVESAVEPPAVYAAEPDEAEPDLVAAEVPTHIGTGPTSVTRRSPAVPDELVLQAMTGDRAAIEKLLAIIHPVVVRYCRGKIARSDMRSVSADDVAQDVCIAVLKALPSYRVQGRPFLAFVYGIAAHKVVDAHRSAGRNRSDPVADVPDRIAASEGPEQRALHSELSGELGRLLQLLPEKQREVLVLRIVVGLSADETAEVVGSTSGAVRVAQHRALARLRKIAPDLGFG